MRVTCLLMAIVLWGGAMAQSAHTVYESTDRPLALALIGDRYHSPIYIRDGLIQALVRENIPVVFLTDHTRLTAETLQQYDLLIFLKDGMIWPDGYEPGSHVQWMSDEQQEAVHDFVRNGKSFLALHNSHGIYPENGLYYELFWGNYGGHPPPEEFTVRIEDHAHPITRGVEDFMTYDEQHLSEYHGDREHLLLRNISKANQAAPAGWWREFGQGRFVYLAPGHTPEALNHPMMQRLIRNSARWLLRLDEEANFREKAGNGGS